MRLSVITALVLGSVAFVSAADEKCNTCYSQCGGQNWPHATCCESGFTCKKWNPYYSQCVPDGQAASASVSVSPASSVKPQASGNSKCNTPYSQCGGQNWPHATCCVSGYTCKEWNPYYSQCIPDSEAASGSATTKQPSAIHATTTKGSSAAGTTNASTTSTKQITTTTKTATSSKPETTQQATTTTKKPSTTTTTSKQATSTSSSGGSGDYKPISGGSSGSGTTTRYWDCCKASCSWPGKASVSKPVGTCAKDGVTLVDANTQSGCNGGSGYMCNDNQPWEVNDNLSYGFAAASIAGKTEEGWCCSCYELTFTSGAVEGKKMVVQVTNTGGDLGSNHFDLQIPGGGVGIFNGCQSQWGAPADGWGARYGGISSKSECAKLPKELQAGCEWRFGWFQNADNPSVSFKEVTCPAELTKKTGCSRS